MPRLLDDSTKAAVSTIGILPPIAQKKMQCWIRSRHLICSGNFFLFETVDYSAIERFSTCIKSLGGSVISVNSVGKIWRGNHRQVILYRAKASLHTPHHNLKQYWMKYGNFRTRFDQQI
ncbi:MAG: CpeR family transcriptional regulator [Cyanobacteria bacterium P01_F01_bin.3]